MTHRASFQKIFAGLLMISMLALTSKDTQSKTETSGSISLAYEYDSNVSVDEIDRSSSKGDSASLFNADLRVTHDFTDTTSSSVSLDYTHVGYRTFDQLNRKTLILSANVDKSMGAYTVGLDYFFIDARLNGKKFLSYQRIAPSVSGFLNKRWFVRASYVYAEKSIENRPGREAINDGLEMDAYYFVSGLRQYLILGYTFRNEDSVAERYAYESHQVKLRGVYRTDVLGRLAAMRIGVRYEDRAYRGLSPSIEERRWDNRLRFSAEFEIPVSENFYVTFYGGYGDYDSNLPSADYYQSILGGRIEFVF